MSLRIADLFVLDTQSKYGDAPTSTVNGVSEGSDGNWGDGLADWLGRAADVYSAVVGSDKLVTKNAPDNPTKASQEAGKSNTMIYIIGGVVVLLAVVFFMRR